MGYRKGPVGYMKASTGNKAVGYMAEGSDAYMSALHQTDPKDGSNRINAALDSLNKKKEADAYANKKAKTDAANQKKLAELKKQSEQRQAAQRENKARVDNVVDSLQTVEQQGELAAAKKYGNFTRAVSEGKLPSTYGGNTRGRSVSSPDTGNLNTNKSPYGKGLSTNADSLESTSTTKVFQKQQNEMAKEKPQTYPTPYDAARGTFQGYRS
jgi:hypothetical protein